MYKDTGLNTILPPAVNKEPTFALGDSSGISPSILYTIILVDFTCLSSPILHYARANFKNNFDITNIDTQSAALQAYKAPGAFGETGDNRQYGFLMYTNPGFKQIDTLILPKEGEAFDVAKFQSQNGLGAASAGVGMVVKLGGTADCGGDGASASAVSDTASTAKRSSTTTEQTSTAEQTSIAEQTSTTAARSASTTAAILRSTSAASATPTEVASQPETTTSPSSTTEDSSVIDASTSSETSTAASSIITSTIVIASGGASSTASSGVALQTANTAAGSSPGQSWFIAALLVAAGMMA